MPSINIKSHSLSLMITFLLHNIIAQVEVESKIGAYVTLGVVLAVFALTLFWLSSSSKRRKEAEEAKLKALKQETAEALLAELLIETRKAKEQSNKTLWALRALWFFLALIVFFGVKTSMR